MDAKLQRAAAIAALVRAVRPASQMNINAMRMDVSACVLISSVPAWVNSQMLREHFQTSDGDSRIRRLITFSKIGTALIEFHTPKDAADVLTNNTELQVRGLLSVFLDEDMQERTVAGDEYVHALLEFLQSLPNPTSDLKFQGSGASQLADLDMDPDACLIVSGFPADLYECDGYFNLLYLLSRQLFMLPEIGAALMECPTPEWADNILTNWHQLLEKTGMQARKLTPLFSPKEDVTTLQRQMRSKEQQLQSVTTVNKSLQAALRHEREAQRLSTNLCQMLEQENVHLKNQAEADKWKIEQLEKQRTSNSYQMSHDPRGVAIIINNIQFEDMAEREGAEGDTDRLREVFESLGFTVVTFCDLDHSKMVAVMKDQGKADHSNYDCFVCCIMSHGTMGKVFSSDDVGIDICELMKPVNARKCPSLKGKPKLFFIQACQGEKCQGRESFDGDHDANPAPVICHEADFFLGLATVPGYVARRDGDGAPYVKHLAKMLKDFGPTHDLSAIMAMVCDKMNEINDDKFGWISSNHSTLRKQVTFKAK